MFRFGFSKASFPLYPAWIRCFGVFEDMGLRNWFHCKSPALRTFLPCALGMWELSLRINFIETSRNVPRCVQATSSIFFPKENTYSFTRSFKDDESRAKQDGDSLFPVTPVRTHHCGSQHPPDPVGWGHPRATFPVPHHPCHLSCWEMGDLGFCHPVPLCPPLYLLGIAIRIVISSFSVSLANG